MKKWRMGFVLLFAIFATTPHVSAAESDGRSLYMMDYWV